MLDDEGLEEALGWDFLKGTALGRGPGSRALGRSWKGGAEVWGSARVIQAQGSQASDDLKKQQAGLGMWLSGKAIAYTHPQHCKESVPNVGEI